MRNMQKPDKISLMNLITNLKKGSYLIPDFQRAFEWSASDVTALLNSIFSDYYIGTLLLWEGTDSSYDILDCKPMEGFRGTGKSEYIVLDGQQRLTAIYHAFFYPDTPFPKRKSRYLFYINVETLFSDKKEEAIAYAYAEKWAEKLLNNPEMQYKQHIFPLSLIGEDPFSFVNWINKYIDFWEKTLVELEIKLAEIDEIENEQKEINQNIENAKASISRKDGLTNQFTSLLSQFQITYIELTKEIEIEKVCDIFTQINSRGVPLDIFDLLNAMLRPKEIKLKEMWKNSRDRISYANVGKMNIYVLQVISILKQFYCSPKYLYYLIPGGKKVVKSDDGKLTSITLIETPEEFIAMWDMAVKSIETTLINIFDPKRYAAIKSDLIPYPSQIPVLASLIIYIQKNEIDGPDTRRKIDNWYWSSIFSQRYSSSVESTAARDFQDLQKWFNNDDYEPPFVSEFMNEFNGLNLKNERQKNSAIYKAIFNLYILKGANDFITLDSPNYKDLDDHHIVPHSWGKDLVGKDIDSVLNRTPLSSNTNRKIINAKLPNIYLKELLDNNNSEHVKRVLNSHFINDEALKILLRDPFTPEDYYAFLNVRQELIMRGISDLLIQGLTDLTPDLLDLNEQISSLEICIRSLISDKLQNKTDLIPSDIRIKTEKLIEIARLKNPSLNINELRNVDKFLSYANLSDCFGIIENKGCWSLFEDIFHKKDEYKSRWTSIIKLRNSLAHNRAPDEIERGDGVLALKWIDRKMSN
jgi:hypothetical protein